MVYPVPDSTPTEEVGALDSLPVVGESAAGVTHGVGILGDVEGVLDLVLALDSTFDPAYGRVLVGAHVHDVVVTLVLDGASGVYGLGGPVALDEVLPRACFVT